MSGAALLLKILLVPVTVLAIGFFEAAETALTSLSNINLSRMKARHPKLQPFFQFWEEHPDKVLAAIILATTLFTALCGTLVASLGGDLAGALGVSPDWLILLLSFLATLVVLLFGEILPKILGRLRSEWLASVVIVPLVPFTQMVQPLVQGLVRIAGLFVRVLGVESYREVPTLSARDFKTMLETEASPGSASPQRMLKNILEFGQLRVRDVMKPREKVVAVNLNKHPREAIAQATESPYSRIPVYKDSLDNIAGIIYAKDLLSAWRTEGLILIPDLLRPAYFVSEDALVSELLREFKKGRHHFGIVQNQAKKVVGIVTIEDLIEEIVGDIYDESNFGEW